jgi:low affinity Fe/Cu permease
MNDLFSKIAHKVAKALGKPIAFIIACSLIIVWALSGPLFGFSDTWQLLVNTSTTISTFLMMFVLQNTQNRDTQALHVKLDELICVTTDARDDLMDLENKTDTEIAEQKAKVQAGSHPTRE